MIAPTPFAPFPLSRASERWRRYAAAPKRQIDESVEIVRPRYLAIPGEPGWAQVSRSVAAAARGAIGSHPAPLIHAHFITPGGMAARRLTRESHRPYVITVHGHDATPGRRPCRCPRRVPRGRPRRRRGHHGQPGTRGEGRSPDGHRDGDAPARLRPARLAALRLPRDEARQRLGVPADRTLVLFVGGSCRSRASAARGRPAHARVAVPRRPAREGPLAGHRAEEDPGRAAPIRRRPAGGGRGLDVGRGHAGPALVPGGAPTVLVEGREPRACR